MTDIDVTKGRKVDNLEQLEKNIENSVYTKNGCKFCNSKYRSEAESLWDRTKSIRRVYEWLVKQGEDISEPAVRNHLLYHYEKQKLDMQILEYVQDIKRYRIESQDRARAREDRKAILNHQLIELGAKTANVSIDDQRKNATAMKQLSDAILNIEKEIAAEERMMEPVFILVGKLRELVQDQLSDNPSQEVRESLTKLLADVGDAMNNLMEGD